MAWTRTNSSRLEPLIRGWVRDECRELLPPPPVLWLLDIDGKRYRMRYRTEGEGNACVGIKPHGRPGIMNATAATPSTSRKREERSKYDRGEYELHFAAHA